MTSIRVLSQSFDCPQPYTEGHICTAAEAGELNRLRTQRVIAQARKKLTSNPATSLGELMAIAQGYTFTSHYVPPTDPAEIEALKIAKGLVRESLTKRGESIESLGKPEFDRLVHEVANKSAVRNEASRRINATQAIANAALLSPDEED